jgi:cold-inducible RNA-binding protein
MKDIFVGNLEYETSEDELRQLFTAYGSVDRVSIVTDRYSGQPRGVAFVEMASAGDADKAITELNGTQLHSRKLDVNEARRSQSAPTGAGKAENAAEAGDVGNHEATISSEHRMRGSPKDRGVRCGNGLPKMRSRRSMVLSPR